MVVCYKSIAIFQDCKLLTSVDIKYEGTCASSRPGGKLFAIGGNVCFFAIKILSQNMKEPVLYIYTIKLIC